MFYLPQWGLNKVANVKSSDSHAEEESENEHGDILKEMFHIGADLGILLFTRHLGGRWRGSCECISVRKVQN